MVRQPLLIFDPGLPRKVWRPLAAAGTMAVEHELAAAVA